MGTRLRTISALGVAVFIAGCGGGSGSNNSGSSGGNGSGSGVNLTTTVTIDPAVPAAAAGLVKTVQSADGSTNINATASYPSGTLNGESLLFGLDANGNVLLASITPSAATTLSATSTAVAFVRIALGALPSPGPAGAQANQSIEATTEFPNLVALITTALTTGGSPADSGAVQASVATVITQYQPVLAAQIQSARASVAAVAMLRTQVSDQSVVVPLPFAIIGAAQGQVSSGETAGSVYIDKSAGGSSVDVVNSTLIDWTASVPPAAIVPLPAADLTSLVTAPAGTVIAGPSPSFDLTVAADNYSNISGSLVSAGAAAASLFAPSIALTPTASTCIKSVVSGAMSANSGAKAIVAATTGSVAKGLLQSWIATSDFANAIVQPIIGCLGNVVTSTNGAFGSLATYFNIWSKFISASTAAVKISQTIYYWGDSVSDQVCASGGNVQNCTSMNLQPSTPSIPEGGAVTLSVGIIPGPSVPLNPPAFTGTVSFVDQFGTALCSAVTPNAQGVAQCPATITTTAVGPDTITATFGNDQNYESANATATVALVVVPTTTTVISSPTAVPSSGGTVTLTATVSPTSPVPSGTPAPIGTMTFTDATGATFCTQPAAVTAGVATCAATITSAPDTITVNYSGDANYAPSSGTTTVNVTSAASYVYYIVFQSVFCGQTATASFTITGGGQTFTESRSATGVSDANPPGPCQGGFDGQGSNFTFGPYSLAIQSGTTYTGTFEWSSAEVTDGSGATYFSYEEYEIDYATGGNLTNTQSANTVSGSVPISFTTPP